MRITINNETVDPNLSDITTFSQLFQRLVDEYLQKGTVVVSVKLNREDLTEEKMENLASFPVSRIDSLELESAQLSHLILDGVEKINGLIEQLMPALEETADRFRTQPEEEANRYFRECLDGVSQMVEFIENFEQVTGLDFSSEVILGTQVSDRQKKLLDLTGDLHKAQVEKDWVMLADQLEYELVPLLQEWLQLFPVLMEKAQNRIH